MLRALNFGPCRNILIFFPRLKNPAWRETLDKELVLCSSKTIPLCNPSRELQTLTKETKRHNLSQLSQLSFEELEGKFVYDC